MLRRLFHHHVRALTAALAALLLLLLPACSSDKQTSHTSSSSHHPAASSQPGSAAGTPDWAKGMKTVRTDRLPEEARKTLQLIDKGGPFPYSKDGTVFGNYEKRLPKQKRGYYHEYTVPTPGARNRGAQRIISGDHEERYYTADHYKTFEAVVRP
ncbi:ribonuclease domain-containing protein [Streptomyces sp. NPDC057654]|uniref:ribonuclease domain-containing protein n=1 Tax=Streptomyces sp. NPDC057654 TaxID=3346196 RepID=UPI0036A4E1FE